jgi:sulfur relay protein TusB/DsrH
MIVLMEDAVIGANSPSSTPYLSLINKGVSISCLLEDFTARGFSEEKMAAGIQSLHYGNLIDLIDSSSRVFSWL